MKTLFIIMSFAFVSVGTSQTTNAPDSSQTQAVPLIERSYKAEGFIDKVRQLMTPKSGESDFQLLVRFFKQNKIEIQQPEAMFLEGKFHMLFIRATQADQDKIEALITKVQDGK